MPLEMCIGRVDPLGWDSERHFNLHATNGRAGSSYADVMSEVLRQERLRIARDLHDDVLQDLTAIVLQLREDAANLEVSRAAIQRAASAAARGVSNTRRILGELRNGPGGCCSPGKCSALRDLIEQLARDVFFGAGPSFRSDIQAGLKIAPMRIEQIRPIVREGMVNILKHADARMAGCKAGVYGGWLQLELYDDGIGFDSAKVAGGFGLIGIAERAEQIGAEIDLRSRPGQGTRLCLRTRHIT
jgi:NarL family two-component system sensor histidine kinase YdfH